MKKRFVFFVLMFAFFNAMGRNQAQAATGVPGAPTAFTVTPDAGGALSAVLNWKNPAVTAAGDPLDSISFIVVRRDGKELTKIEKPNPGVAGTYTDTKPERGNHIYTVRAYNSKGDGIYAFKEAFTGGTYPCAVPLSAETYVEDFEDPTRYPCTIIYCEPTSESRFNEWGIKNGSPNEAHTGTGFAFSSGGMNPTKEGWLILPKVSLPAGKIYNMTFWSYNLYPDRYYKNSVLISDGSVFPEGGDYKEVWSPASVTEPWTQSEINLSDYAGKEVYIAFRYSANYWWCNSWYLDDIVFKEAPIADAGITAIINPVTGALTGTEPVTIKVKNIGSQKLTDIPVKAEIDNSLVLSGKIDSLAIGEEKNYTFAQTIDCSVL
ncbi:MAG: choice-of-anchor J domain-containing protein, partial [Dysgonamonadaceae bacterium]|nr:choice-of-anchor J domain-containing protein [Dysgonamonadaceae bacterium]